MAKTQRLGGAADEYNQDDINAELDHLHNTINTFAVPVGVYFPFAGTVIPDGYLLCDGRNVSRTKYAALFAVLGISHGAGDNTLTFNLPDLRGRFVRGVSGESSNDPDKATRTASNAGGNTGNNVGSLQSGSVGAHDHVAERGTGIGDAGGDGYCRSVRVSTDSGEMIDSTGTGIGNETRPVNVYANYIIKY